MKQRKLLALLLSFAMLISFVASGCGIGGTASDNPPARYRNPEILSFLPKEKIEMVKLSEIQYVAPDTRDLEDKCQALLRKIETCTNAEELLADYYEIYPEFCTIQTMYKLAFLRNNIDTTDPFYKNASMAAGTAFAIAMNYQDELLYAFASSPVRNELEKLYFGEGYFDQYDVKTTYSDQYYTLLQLESNYVCAFDDLTTGCMIPYNGEEKAYNEWLCSDSNEIRNGASAAYIEQYHDKLANIYIELVKTRQKIAKEAGFDSYIDYQYEYFGDFNSKQTAELLQYIKTYLAPLAKPICEKRPGLSDNLYNDKYPYSKDTDPIETLCSASKNMGDVIWDAARFLKTYELYEYSYSPNKRIVGYQSYLRDYEAPFIFFNPARYDAVASFAHEFGHFVDGYYNYGDFTYAPAGVSSALSEFFSQSMQYLLIKYAETFPEDIHEETMDAALADLLITNILDSAAFAAFEEQVYNMDPKELTPDKLDEVYLQYIKEFGRPNRFKDSIQAKSWVLKHHLFEDSCICILYTVPAISALQICSMDDEKDGAGVAVYIDAVKNYIGKTYDRFYEESKLDSPFKESTVKDIAEYLKNRLN
ncbi:MAG: hypothetical protein J5876_03290 [Lachnospiraceae bacterium]|nr:hypothetical protein [Lachnospiraceae bacterium]